MVSLYLPNELVNHIFSYCQSRTNKIMKNHIKDVNEYKEQYVENNLINILHLMEFYSHIHFDKIKFHSRFYRCMNCSRVGFAQPRIEFGEKFCSYTCADQFDY
jgi:hypothetical protein